MTELNVVAAVTGRGLTRINIIFNYCCEEEGGIINKVTA